MSKAKHKPMMFKRITLLSFFMISLLSKAGKTNSAHYLIRIFSENLNQPCRFA
jgi:hypothetical protein